MRPPAWKVWWLAARPATLTASLAPVIAGTALAHRAGAFRMDVLVLALLGAALIQVGTNLANDYFDFKKGADNEDRLGPPRVTQKGWVSPEAVRNATIASFVLATLAGVGLVAIGGWPIAILGIASIAAGVGYTAGRYALAYLGLGELFVFAFFGIAAVCATTYLHGAAIGIDAIAAGAALGALASAILVVNNLRDRDTDLKAHKRTLAVRIGSRWTRWQYALLVALPYALAAARMWWVPLLTLPLAVALIRKVNALDGRALNPLLGHTAKLELAWAALFAVGVSLS